MFRYRNPLLSYYYILLRIIEGLIIVYILPLKIYCFFTFINCLPMYIYTYILRRIKITNKFNRFILLTGYHSVVNVFEPLKLATLQFLTRSITMYTLSALALMRSPLLTAVPSAIHSFLSLHFARSPRKTIQLVQTGVSTHFDCACTERRLYVLLDIVKAF